MNRFFTGKRMAMLLLLTVMALLAAACSGDEGERGLTGPAGSQGTDGASGQDGATGATGPQGGAGSQGDTGAEGDTGAKGDTGDTGAAGFVGKPGDPGPRGGQGESTHADVALSAWTVEADAAVDLTAYFTGFEDDSTIFVDLVFPDGGGTLSLGRVTSGASGNATFNVTHAGLGAGLYAVIATGGKGGRASAALLSVVK